MRQEIIVIGFIIAIVSIIIYLTKNQEIAKKVIEKISKSKIKYFIYIVVIIGLAYLIYNCIFEIRSDIRVYNKNKEYDKIYEYSDEKKIEENSYYREIISKEYLNQSYDEPYILEGFKYVEGTYETGFVIEDENENQYVWVPCTNKNIDGITTLEKRNFVSPAFISKDGCYDENYEEFLESALKNGGFYVSRYEIGNENNIPVSKSNVQVWNDINKKEAKEIISNMYNSENFKCELINGFAYDTTLSWIKSKNDIEKSVIDLEKEEIIYTGRNEYNKIFDFCDNILELTNEIFYDNIVVRGFSAGEDEIEEGISFSDENRYSIFEDDREVSLKDGISFRTILYK